MYCIIFVNAGAYERRGDEFSEEWLEGVESQVSKPSSTAVTTTQPQDSAVGIRDTLTRYFAN